MPAITCPRLERRAPRWALRLDHDGVWLRDLTDTNNEPTWITPSSKQKGAAAYKKAAKVVASLDEAARAYDVSEVLREAGCKLHHFCAVD